MASLSERIDELLERLGEVETHLSSCLLHTQSRNATSFTVGTFANAGCIHRNNGHVNGFRNGYSTPVIASTTTAQAVESPVVEEVVSFLYREKSLRCLFLFDAFLRKRLAHQECAIAVKSTRSRPAISHNSSGFCK